MKPISKASPLELDPIRLLLRDRALIKPMGTSKTPAPKEVDPVLLLSRDNVAAMFSYS
jgi:hypothetical protein